MAIVNKLRSSGALHLKSIEATGTGNDPLVIGDFPASASKGDRVAICYVPPYSVVIGTQVINSTAWNGTGAEVLIGTGTDDDALVAAGDFTPDSTTPLNESTKTIDSGENGAIIYATLVHTAKPTAGESHVTLTFVRYGDTRESGGKLGYTGDVDVIEPMLITS